MNCRIIKIITVKGMANMNTLNNYIDICLVNEYADKDLFVGYSLDISSVSEHDRNNFLDQLMKHDESFKDMILDYMQEAINKNLVDRECEDRDSMNLSVKHYSNGDKFIAPKKAS